MPEVKKIRVRKARGRDVGLFRKLWMERLRQNAENGSIVVPDSESLASFELLFNLYTEEGGVEGIVLFVADKAVLMWGDPGLAVHYKPGKIAMAWGHFISDEGSPEGTEKALLAEAEAWARKKGFSGVEGQFCGELPEGFKAQDSIAYWIFEEVRS